MKKYGQQQKGMLSFLLAFLILALFALGGPAGATGLDLRTAASSQTPDESKVASTVRDELAALPAGEMTTVIVTLQNQADLSHIAAGSRGARLEQVIKILQNQANATQNYVRALLQARQSQGLVATYQSYWVFNGLAVTATADVIEELATRPEVARITSNAIAIEPAAQAGSNPPEVNLAVVNAPALWDLGYQGQGVVVASMDTGVYKDHPDLVDRWRGGANSWFDPYGEHPSTPADLNGHGTWTMGVMVGGDAGGTALGMAPAAQWIAVKIFDDSGQSTAAGIHAGFQWLLDPDGDPSTADAPNVVNNSWTFSAAGCNLEFQQDLLSLRAAGILPVFAAGNAGPSSDTSRSPANNPGAFAVGATDNDDIIYFESSRGPSACDAGAVYPALVAPGVAIRTADNSGFYYNPSGTSLAAPHVAGTLALLLSADPGLTTAAQEESLINGAVDLGSAGPDADFGYGRLDALAAYQWLLANPAPTPTPSPTAAPVTNLALGGSVIVSSAQDGNHNGAMAVDGDSATEWHSKKASGKHAANLESIEVDLGAIADVDQAVLLWGENFATAYDLELSLDGSNWIPVFNTTTGGGGMDTISFPATPARYARMVSTSWNDNSLRNWLAEFEVYGTLAAPAPTSTPTTTSTPAPSPTPTDTPSPTPSPTPGSAGTMHLGNLNSSTRKMGQNWKATVTVVVHTGDETPLSGATVYGTWGAGYSGADSCVTDNSGSCSLATGKIDGQQAFVTFTVDDLSLASYAYLAADNHDPAGSTVTINGP